MHVPLTDTTDLITLRAAYSLALVPGSTGTMAIAATTADAATTAGVDFMETAATAAKASEVATSEVENSFRAAGSVGATLVGSKASMAEATAAAVDRAVVAVDRMEAGTGS